MPSLAAKPPGEAHMPNGTREPYRLSSRRTPSPLHTSDSEDTKAHKKRYKRNRERQLAAIIAMENKVVNKIVEKIGGGTVHMEFAPNIFAFLRK